MLVIQPHTEVFHTGKVLVPEVRIKMRLYFNSPVLHLNGVGLAGCLHPEDIEMRFQMYWVTCVLPKLWYKKQGNMLHRNQLAH